MLILIILFCQSDNTAAIAEKLNANETFLGQEWTLRVQ